MKRLIWVVILIPLFLVGCSRDTESTQTNLNISEEHSESISQKEEHFTINGQTFTIIPFYEEHLEYIQYVNENPYESYRTAYTEKVLNPLKEKSSLALKVEYPFLATYLKTELEETTTYLLEHQDEINEYIKDALHKSVDLLPGGDVTIYVLPLRKEDKHVIENMQGVAGFTINAKTIILFLDSGFSEEVLKYSVAHEYHHTVNKLTFSIALLENVINEGKADSFASIVYPETKVPWTESLSKETFDKVVAEISKKADSRSLNDY